MPMTPKEAALAAEALLLESGLHLQSITFVEYLPGGIGTHTFAPHKPPTEFSRIDAMEAGRLHHLISGEDSNA